MKNKAIKTEKNASLEEQEPFYVMDELEKVRIKVSSRAYILNELSMSSDTGSAERDFLEAMSMEASSNAETLKKCLELLEGW